jgi:hypothetical protein
MLAMRHSTEGFVGTNAAAMQVYEVSFLLHSLLVRQEANFAASQCYVQNCTFAD